MSETEDTATLIVLEQTEYSRLIATLTRGIITIGHEYRVAAQEGPSPSNFWRTDGVTVQLTWDEFDRLVDARKTLKL